MRYVSVGISQVVLPTDVSMVSAWVCVMLRIWVRCSLLRHVLLESRFGSMGTKAVATIER